MFVLSKNQNRKQIGFSALGTKIDSSEGNYFIADQFDGRKTLNLFAIPI